MILKLRNFMLFLIVMACLSGLEASKYNFNFKINSQGWTGDFTDYPKIEGNEAFYNLQWGWTNLPQQLVLKTGLVLDKGMYLSGDNRSDDLFMFIRRKLGGLKPETLYDLKFHVVIENDVSPGQAGIGGAPGESVYFKVGASRRKPQKKLVDGFYLLNVDKGNQSNGGKNARVVGDMANSLVNPENPQFEPKTFSNITSPLRMKTDKKGKLWVFVGTDSGFEGTTLYYIAKIKISAKAVKK